LHVENGESSFFIIISGVSLSVLTKCHVPATPTSHHS